MSGSFEETFEGGVHQPLPRFLLNGRAGAGETASWASLMAAKLRWLGIPVAAGGVLAASVFLTPDSPRGMTPAHAPIHEPIHAETIRVRPVRIAVREAEPAASLEERLSYARRLQSQFAELDQMARIAPAPLQETETVHEVPLATGGIETASLLLVRGLPENVTFNDGVPAGIGVWAIGGQDARELVAALKDGSPRAVVADVEVISGSGITLSQQTVELPAAKEADVADVPASPPSDAETVKAQDVAATAKPPVRAKKHVRRAARAAVAAAEDDDDDQKPKVKSKTRKRKTVDAYRMPKAAASLPDSETRADKAQAAQVAEQENQGPLGKFFNWLSGGSKNKGTAAPANDGEADTSLRGYGLAPD